MRAWRSIADVAKANPRLLKVADWLGRGRGRLRFLDELSAPAPAPRRIDLRGWESHELAAAWVGHATMLIRLGETTILTDPVFSRRVGLGMGLLTAGPGRFFAPALTLHELPRVDVILVSHAHYDHLDRPTLARLSKRIPVIAAENTADLIRDLGFDRVEELRWGESIGTGPLRITAQPVRHWGARTFIDPHRGYTAFLLESTKRRVLFGGDTAYCDFFRECARVDLAILGIGGYNPYIHGHASPEQVWEMANHCQAEAVFPMHHSTFRLSVEPMGEPLARLLEAAGPGASRLVARRIGDQWHL